MTPNEFQKACLRTEVTPPFITETIVRGPEEALRLARVIHGMIGIATEGGEMQDQVKRHLMYSKPIDYVNIMEEAFDTIWYCMLTLDGAGYTFEDTMKFGLDKLRRRFPEKFSEERALNRDLSAERQALEGK